MKSWLHDARKASNMTPEDCASVLHCSRVTYLSRENAPGTLSLDEMHALYRAFGPKSRTILWGAVCEFRP